MKLVVNENTYVTVSEADRIVSNYLTSDSEILSLYDNMDDDDKTIILYRSCLDMQKLKYRGFKQDQNQKLAFPRVNRVGYKSDDDMVKLAQVINSLSFINGGSTNITQLNMLSANNVTNFKLGSFSISLADGKPAKSNSGAVENILAEWLTGGVKIRW